MFRGVLAVALHLLLLCLFGSFALFDERFLVLLRLLVLVLVVGPGVALRECAGGCGHAEDQQKSAGDDRFHRLTVEAGLAESYQRKQLWLNFTSLLFRHETELLTPTCRVYAGAASPMPEAGLLALLGTGCFPCPGKGV